MRNVMEIGDPFDYHSSTFVSIFVFVLVASGMQTSLGRFTVTLTHSWDRKHE